MSVLLQLTELQAQKNIFKFLTEHCVSRLGIKEYIEYHFVIHEKINLNVFTTYNLYFGQIQNHFFFLIKLKTSFFRLHFLTFANYGRLENHKGFRIFLLISFSSFH